MGTLGDAIGDLNIPKDIGKFNFRDFRDIRDIRDIQDFGLGDIGRCHILEHSTCILENSGKFWNILHAFCNTLEHSGTFWNILEQSGDS